MVIYEKEIRPGIYTLAIDATADLSEIPHLIKLCTDFKVTMVIQNIVGLFHISEAPADFLIVLKLSSKAG